MATLHEPSVPFTPRARSSRPSLGDIALHFHRRFSSEYTGTALELETQAADERTLGDFRLLPPEVLEQIMSEMSPLSLLPLMLSNAIFYGLGASERVWDAAYQRVLPRAHRALHLAHNPELWLFSMPSSIRFLHALVSNYSTPLDAPDDELRSIVTTMQAHEDSALTQQAAVYIVRRLAYYPHGCDQAYRDQVEHSRSRLGELGVVESLLRVVYLYPDHTLLLAGAFCAIGNISIDPVNCKKLVEVAGLKLLLAALKLHPDSASVIDFGCFALCNIADEIESRTLLVEEGFVNYTLTIVDSESRPEAEMQPALDLLATLMQEAEAKAAYGRRVLERLAQLFKRESLGSDFLKHLLTALVVTCEASEENRDIALQIGLSAPVQHFLDSRADDAGVYLKGSLCLFTLYWQRPEPEMAALRLALIDRICAAMRTFRDDVATQRTSAAMLSDLAHADADMRAHVVAQGGRALVERAMALQADTGDPEADAEWRLFAQFIRIE